MQILLPIIGLYVQKESLIHICDNTTVRWLKIFQIYKKGRGHSGSVGYIFFGTIRKILPPKRKKLNVLNLKRGSKIQGQIVRTRQWTRRLDGHQIKAEDNSGLLIRARLILRGWHMVGPVFKEVGRRKIVAQNTEVI